MNNLPRAIIFDFDGTIADSAEIFAESLLAAIGRKQNFNETELRDMRNSSTQEIIKKLGIKKWQLPKVLMRGKREITKRMERVEPFTGIPEILKKLAKSDAKIFIVSTNTRRNIEDFLEKYQLEDCIDGIYADIGLFGKVKALQKLVRQNSLLGKNCVYVGDETRDIEAARKAGIKCIAVDWGYTDPVRLQASQPDARAAVPGDLEKLLAV